jgi:phage tail sheath gpL-like
MAVDALKDGFVSICIDPSLNTIDEGCKLLIEGQAILGSNAGEGSATADTLVKVSSVRDVDTLFGVGSVLSESLKKAFCMCPEDLAIYALPREDAATAVKAEYTLTVSGSATSDGTVSVFLLDENYSIIVPVLSGATATDIAQDIADEISANFPYTATAAAGVVTFVAKNGGTIGNYLSPVVNWQGFANYAPKGVTFEVERTEDGTNNPPVIDRKSLLGDCCYDCYAALTDDVNWQKGVQAYIKGNWSCDEPQCFGHGYTFNSGTLGQILGSGNNAGELNRLAYHVDDPNSPYMLVAAYAALSCCTSCDNWELSIQGQRHGLLDCIKRPTSCKQSWNSNEVENLKANGFVVFGASTLGSGRLTSPYIYNDVTNYLYDENNKDNYTFRATIHRRWAKQFSVNYAEFINDRLNGLSVYADGTTIPNGKFGITKIMVRAKLIEWLRDQEGDLISPIQNIDKEVKVLADFETKAPCKGKPGKYRVELIVRPPVRASGVDTTIAPKLIDNCERTPTSFTTLN